MIIDFHTHGKLAKNLPFSEEYTRWMFQQAKEAGLDALCLTEHFNTLYFDELYRFIIDNYTEDGDSFIAEGVRVFLGMEIDIEEKGHILAIGTIDNILSLNRELEAYKTKGNFLEFKKLLNYTQKYGVFLGAAHPFREGSNIPKMDLELLKELDFIDLNGKDYASKGEKVKQEVNEFSEKLNIPVVGGSDTHQGLQYGSIFNDFNVECRTINELISNIYEGKYEIGVSEDIKLKVKTAGILKKALKEIHACGGNYVSVLTQ